MAPIRKPWEIPYDTPIPGYDTRTVSRLRLWTSEAVDDFNLSVFYEGDYAGAVPDKIEWETISKVLYPPDEKVEGKRLRLMQQFFFHLLLTAEHGRNSSGAR